MANYQSAYKSVLSDKLIAGATTAKVQTAPTALSGRMLLVNGNTYEYMDYTGVTGTTLTGVTRDISTTADPATSQSVGLDWSAGATIILVQMHDQIPSKTANNTWEGDQTFNGDATFNGVMNFSNIGDVNVNGKSNPQPVVADTTARDALYTAPVTGDVVYVTALNAMQIYNGNTAQWETLDVGTPSPVATTSVQGIMKIHAASADPKAIVSEEAGTSGTAVSASNKLVDSADTRLGLQEYTPNNSYQAGETLSAGNVVFIEPAPTTAQATSAQNIGDVTANTRVSFPVFGSGVAGTTLKLNLAKTGSPSVDLGVRIETDNAGSPSGTLVNANATGTVAAASLTTSLADTTITLAGSITIPAGQKCHAVVFQGTYGSETVNASNYYKIGYYTNDSTTRSSKAWDGSDWEGTISLIETTGDTLSAWGNSTDARGHRVTALRNGFVTAITKNASCTSTRGLVRNSSGTIIGTATFSGNTATLSGGGAAIVSGQIYYIETDGNGASITHRTGTPTNPTRVALQFTGGSIDGVYSAASWDIESVTTNTYYLPTEFIYTSSTIFSDKVLSKTDADYSYKIDWLGISQEAVTAGDLATGKYPTIAIEGIDSNQSGMTQGQTMYLSNTPGAISSSAGSNNSSIGTAITSTKLQIVKSTTHTPSNTLATVIPSVVGNDQTASGTLYTATKSGFFEVQMDLYNSTSGSNTYGSFTVTIYSGNYVYATQAHLSGTTSYYFTIPSIPGKTISWQVTSFSASWNTATITIK